MYCKCYHIVISLNIWSSIIQKQFIGGILVGQKKTREVGENKEERKYLLSRSNIDIHNVWLMF